MLLPFSSAHADGVPQVGKWRRIEIVLPNPSFGGNPFELEVNGTFVHSGTNTTLTLPGFYAGNDTWKIAFMPTAEGVWTYVTNSSDSDLDGVAGSLDCIASGRRGMLAADPSNPRKWKFSDGPHVVPIGLLLNIMYEDGTLQDLTLAADKLKNDVAGHLFNFRLTNLVFDGPWTNHELDTALWDRLDERMAMLTERDLGIMVMAYTDDSGTPPWPAQSPTEALLFRYMVARLASYPMVFFNTGIDIIETRNQAWIDWYGSLVRGLDPYNHPISSRNGSSGSGFLVMAGQTYDSKGDRTAVVADLIADFEASTIPFHQDDNWGEEANQGFLPGDIRRGAWKCVIAGGCGLHVRDNVAFFSHTWAGNDTNDPDRWFTPSSITPNLDSAPWLKLVGPFVENDLGVTFATMLPDSSLVTNGFALADPARTKILYFLMGVNDAFDFGDGDDVTVRLSGLAGSYLARWFDPRTGDWTAAGNLAGGVDHLLSPPSTDDWILLLTNGVPIFEDGFESGDTGAWSSTVGG